MEQNNPFTTYTPEDLAAKEAVDLFVDEFTDFDKLREPGHTIMRGPRGVGKSMMLRYLRPDCQLLVAGGDLCNLDRLCFYVPLKSASFTMLSEIKLFNERFESALFLEHLMVCFVMARVFSELEGIASYSDSDTERNDLKVFFGEGIEPLLFNANESPAHTLWVDEERYSTSQAFGKLRGIFDQLYQKAVKFAYRSTPDVGLRGYNGPLFGYLDDFLPAMRELKKCSFLPAGTMFLLVDDAHALTRSQTRVLNSWIYSRTSGEVSVKVSTQYDYKTYYTVTGATIDAPHDYADVDLATIYTSSSKDVYGKRVKGIVERRLQLAGIQVKAEEFFPEDAEQEEAINRIKEEYRARHDSGLGRGARASDDATRYARPDFIKGLGGASKSTPSYSYAGFDQLVHLSSGAVRYFIEAAFKMYTEESKRRGANDSITSISPPIQSRVVKDEANGFYAELKRFVGEADSPSDEYSEGVSDASIKMLANLIEGLGSTFRYFLQSDRAERRVFSVALSDEPSEQVARTFDLGVRLGYFHQATIGRKSGLLGGRTALYVLNRRLAPIWTLDPTSFAGYWFTTNKTIEGFMVNPQAEAARVIQRAKGDRWQVDGQMSLFDEYIMDAKGVVG